MKGKFFVSAFKRRWVMAVCALLFVALAAGIPLLVTAQQAPPPPPGPPPALVLPKPPPALSKESLDWMLTVNPPGPSVDVEGGKVHIFAGPPTRGMTIEVAGKPLKLPEDAELGGFIMIVDYLEGKRPTRCLPPAYRIYRGDGEALVSKVTGEFVIVKGTRQQFQFLIDHVGESKACVPPPAR
jgi:hypothetical protein